MPQLIGLILPKYLSPPVFSSFFSLTAISVFLFFCLETILLDRLHLLFKQPLF